MTLRIFLADDERLALARLVAMLETDPDVRIVGTASDGEEAASEIERLRPDLAFLDVRMPKQSGLALARALQHSPDIELIFVTAFDQFAVEAFDLDAVDYLLKPVEADRLATALTRARRRRTPVAPAPAAEESTSKQGGLDGFWLPHRDRPVWLPMESINWIEAARDYVLLHTAQRSHMMRATMSSLQEQLDAQIILRVSRSAFVRLDAVRRVTRQGSAGYVAVLCDGAVIRVGTTFAPMVLEALRTTASRPSHDA